MPVSQIVIYLISGRATPAFGSSWPILTGANETGRI